LQAIRNAIAGATSTASDQGAAILPRQSYSLPTVNDTNVGVGGEDAETDDEFRARIPRAFAASETGTAAAVRAAVEAVPGISYVFVEDAVLGGSPPPGTFTVHVVGITDPLDSATDALVRAAVLDNKAVSAAPTPDTYVTLAPVAVNVAYTITPESGVSAAALVPAVDTAILAYFATLELAGTIYVTDLTSAIKAVDGVENVPTITLTPQGGPFVGIPFDLANIVGTPGVLYRAGTRTPTIV
jgi:uncharacterized phage protein gp47/JayE